VIEHCLGAAGMAPSGGTLQPWLFVAVRDPAVKKEIERRRRPGYARKALEEISSFESDFAILKPARAAFALRKRERGNLL